MKFRALLGLAISAIIILWLAYSIHWESFVQELQTLNLWYLLPLTAAILISSLVRAIRWKYFLLNSRDVSLRVLFDTIMIGAMANFILPFRLGDITLPLILKKRKVSTFLAALTAAFLERLVDLIVVLAFFLIIALYIPHIPIWAFWGAKLLGAVSGALFLFILTCCFFPSQIQGTYSWVTQYLPTPMKSAGEHVLHEIIVSATSLKSPRQFILLCLISIGIWGTVFFYYYLFVLSFPYHTTIDHSLIGLAITISVFIALAIAAPSAPGFIGVYQVACMAAFSIFGVSQEKALAYAVVSHLHQMLVSVIYGWYALTRLNLHLTDLQTTDDTG